MGRCIWEETSGRMHLGDGILEEASGRRHLEGDIWEEASGGKHQEGLWEDSRRALWWRWAAPVGVFGALGFRRVFGMVCFTTFKCNAYSSVACHKSFSQYTSAIPQYSNVWGSRARAQHRQDPTS